MLLHMIQSLQMYYFVRNLLEPLFVSIEAIFFVFIWFQFPKQVQTLEPEDMRMWECEDINKQTEYMSLRIRGCEDTRLLASTHEPKDMRIQWCKQGRMNLRMWGCKDAKIQACTHIHRNMKIRGCEDTSKDTHT